MINYEKIKTGKNLTKNQKRLYAIYFIHQQNLEKNIDQRKSLLRVFSESSWSYCFSSTRVIAKVQVVYDNSLTENIKISVQEDTIYPYEGKYRGYAKIEDIIVITLGKKNIISHRRGKVGFIDGIPTFYDTNGKLGILNIEINNRKKDFLAVAFTKTFLARKKYQKKYFYAHSKISVADAKKTVAGKIRLLKKKDRKSHLRFNSIITIKRYHQLTGACVQGCENFATKHNLPFDAKIKVSDLLKLLDKNDFGYNNFIKKLEITK